MLNVTIWPRDVGDCYKEIAIGEMSGQDRVKFLERNSRQIQECMLEAARKYITDTLSRKVYRDALATIRALQERMDKDAVGRT